MTSPFFGAKAPAQPIQIIEVNGCKVQINCPPALKSRHDYGHEVEQYLPPYRQVPAFSVDSLTSLPACYARSQGNEASFIFGVEPNTGLWLDFNANRENTHDLAVLISAQGINAITGKKTDSFALEQNRGGQPPQNYLCSTGSPYGGFWLDGFMAADGVVRQFIFTEEVARGVAANIIGADRVQAIGLAFFQSVNPKPRPAYRSRGGLESFGGGLLSMSPESATRGMSKSIEIGAGARIKQRVDADPKDLSYWNPSPVAVVTLYYVGKDDLSACVASSRPSQGEGFLKDIPHGN